MKKAQVFLRDDQRRGLRAIAARTGRRQSELIRSGVDMVIEKEARKKEDWKAALQGVCGIWKDRDDLEEWFRGIRTDLDSRHKKLFAGKAKDQ
ncbi:MAG: hypothetical protein IIC56_12120 [Proteobacteria bacterium]|nr:hypothetical protein [Pseudomonadota bacterium]